jgi:hypothetical protein
LNRREFAYHYARIQKATAQIGKPVLGVELRRMNNGTVFYIQHPQERFPQCNIFVRLPGTDDWADFEAIKTSGSVRVMQSQLLPTLDESRLSEIRAILKFGKKGAK